MPANSTSAGSGTPADFKLNIQKWAEKATGTVTEEMMREVIREFMIALIQQTPRVSGQLANSWMGNLNAPVPPGAPAQDDPISRLNAILADYRLGDSFQIANVAPYAYRVENGFVGQDKTGRLYNQPGQFFTRRVIMQGPAIAQYAINKVKSKNRS